MARGDDEDDASDEEDYYLPAFSHSASAKWATSRNGIGTSGTDADLRHIIVRQRLAFSLRRIRNAFLCTADLMNDYASARAAAAAAEGTATRQNG